MTESFIACPNPDCEGREMGRVSTADVPDQTGTLAQYECSMCGRRAAVIFNPIGGMSQASQSWVDNELRTNGYVFPADYTGSGSNFGGGGRFFLQPYLAPDAIFATPVRPILPVRFAGTPSDQPKPVDADLNRHHVPLLLGIPTFYGVDLARERIEAGASALADK